jgi:hypothetical protein
MATYTVEINFLTHAEQERFGPSSVTRHRGAGPLEALDKAVARLYGKSAWFNSSLSIGTQLSGAWGSSIYGTAYKPVGGNSSTAVSGDLRIDVIRK